MDIDEVVAISECCGGILSLPEPSSVRRLLALSPDGVLHVVTDRKAVRFARVGESGAADLNEFAVGFDIQFAALTVERASHTELWDGDLSQAISLRSSDLPVAHGKEASGVVPLFDGEGGYKLAGTAGGRLHLWWDSPDGWLRGDNGPATHVDRGSVLASTEEGTTFVAGWIRQSGRARQGLWYTGGDPWSVGPDRWRNWPLPGRFDEITALASWEVGTCAAGRRGTTPLLWDVDNDTSGRTRPIRLPPVSLDRRDPRVLLGDPLCGIVAAQTSKGPIVWTRDHESTRWRTWPAPSGTITQIAGEERRLYAVIDGSLWFRTIPDTR